MTVPPRYNFPLAQSLTSLRRATRLNARACNCGPPPDQAVCPPLPSQTLSRPPSNMMFPQSRRLICVFAFVPCRRQLWSRSTCYPLLGTSLTMLKHVDVKQVVFTSSSDKLVTLCRPRSVPCTSFSKNRLSLTPLLGR